MKFFGGLDRFVNPSPFLGDGICLGNLSVTAGSVLHDPNGTFGEGIAGETITAGQLLYKDASNSNKLMKAVTTTAATAACVGVALESASAGQVLKYQTSGDYTCGSTSAPGVYYAVSDTAGAIALASDNATGDFATLFGIGISTTKIRIGIVRSGVAI